MTSFFKLLLSPSYKDSCLGADGTPLAAYFREILQHERLSERPREGNGASEPLVTHTTRLSGRFLAFVVARDR